MLSFDDQNEPRVNVERTRPGGGSESSNAVAPGVARLNEDLEPHQFNMRESCVKAARQVIRSVVFTGWS